MLSAMQLKERAWAGQRVLKNRLLVFKPATVLKWHRELVKCKWTFQRHTKVGRPRIDVELETLIIRLGCCWRTGTKSIVAKIAVK